MKVLVTRFGAALIAAAAVGLAAAPATADPAGLPLEQTAPVADLVPETGSAGAWNGIMCSLQTLSAALPCMYT
ncbi:hypothetical protein [Nocardia lijiangensis]|uniref:hypothetical protein n=1 Tax=Nocardia lijiangensis TaxID=299618 RepID=UPI003D735B86